MISPSFNNNRTQHKGLALRRKKWWTLPFLNILSTSLPLRNNWGRPAFSHYPEKERRSVNQVSQVRYEKQKSRSRRPVWRQITVAAPKAADGSHADRKLRIVHFVTHDFPQFVCVGGWKFVQARTTPSIGRGKISPHPSLSKRGVVPDLASPHR